MSSRRRNAVRCACGRSTHRRSGICQLCTDPALSVQHHQSGGLIILGQRLTETQGRELADRIHDLLDLDNIFNEEACE